MASQSARAHSADVRAAGRPGSRCHAERPRALNLGAGARGLHGGAFSGGLPAKLDDRKVLAFTMDLRAALLPYHKVREGLLLPV
jgi:hypothetical protein